MSDVTIREIKKIKVLDECENESILKDKNKFIRFFVDLVIYVSYIAYTHI